MIYNVFFNIPSYKKNNMQILFVSRMILFKLFSEEG